MHCVNRFRQSTGLTQSRILQDIFSTSQSVREVPKTFPSFLDHYSCLAHSFNSIHFILTMLSSPSTIFACSLYVSPIFPSRYPSLFASLPSSLPYSMPSLSPSFSLFPPLKSINALPIPHGRQALLPVYPATK